MKSLFNLRFGLSSDNNKSKRDEPVEFEDAIAETSFGKFNIFLMVFMLMVSFAFIFDTTVMSYVVPSAECDLNISLIDKGVLNAIVHVGMICSAPFSGYLADTIGRKAILFGGLAFDAIFNVIATFSHSFLLTLFCKFFSGFFMAGVSTMQLTMMAEFHATKHRSPLTMYTGVTFSFAMLISPVIAWLILTEPYDLYVGSYVFHSWQMYIGASSVPAFVALSCFYFIPESPKFLASRNRTDEALAVMRRIYSINTGKPAETFPVKALKAVDKNDKQVESEYLDEDKSKHKDTSVQNENHIATNITENEATNGGKFSTFMRDGLKQMRPLFVSPHVLKLLLLFTLQFLGVMAQNSIRLWLPQLFKMMSEYSKEDGNFCDMISLGNKTIVDLPHPEDGACEPIKVAAEAYFNSMIVAAIQVGLGTIISLTINYIGRKRILVTSMFTAGVCALSLYWSVTSVQVTTLASLSVSLSLISMNCLGSTNVDLFPTALRAMALSLTLMIGRIGSITGNLMFPALLALGCLPPFLTIASGLFVGTLLSFLLPSPTTHVT